MASLFRREYKIKAEDLAIREESKIDKDLKNWREMMPTIIEKLSSDISDIRLAAIRTLNYQITGQFLGENLEPFVDQLIEGLEYCIDQKFSRIEHDDALAAICNLCLQRMNDFESCAMVVLNNLMPDLPNLEAEYVFRLFSLAFLTSFGITSQEICMRVLTRFMDLLRNKKGRNVEFTPNMIKECLGGINIMLSAFPCHICTKTVLKDLDTILDKCMSSSKPKVLMASLETILIVNDSLKKYEEEMLVRDEGDELDAVVAEAKIFINKYRGKMTQIHQQVEKKADVKDVKSKCDEIERMIDGESDDTLDIVLNNQQVHIEGARHICLVNAIKRISQQHFQQQMSDNPMVHEMLGYELLTRQTATVLKKKYKEDIKHDRAQTKKENQRAIAKKRRNKTERMESEDF